jgi:CubicO group peptidase (beta-lactamase class C family)
MSHRTRSLLALVAAVLASSSGTARAAGPTVAGEVGRKLDEYLSRLERLGYSGGAVVVRGSETVLLKGYGMADRAAGIPITTESVFNLGSITKSFTAAAILKLEMQGRLAVGDPIAKHLDGVPADKSGITLHHLLTHGSGLESDFAPTDYDPVGREEYVRRALASKLLFAPGGGFEYSNAGYSLLAAIVERVTGKAYEDALGELVLTPAGMRETGYKAPAWSRSRIAHGYREGEDWGTILERIDPADAPYWALRGNGGLHTTLGDLLAWHRALGTDAVLSKDARAKYVKPYVAEGPAARSHYAYGWAVGKTRRGTGIVQHNGGNGIYVAELLRFPDEDAMIFLTSTNAEMKATPAVVVLERILFGEPYRLPPLAVAVDAKALAQRAGRYQLAGGGTLLVAAQDGGLALRALDAAGFAALAGAGQEAAARLKDLTARTADIAGRGFKGDVSGLYDAMGGRRPVEELREQEAGMMADRERRLGAFKGMAALGSAPRDEGRIASVVRLDFEKRAVFNVYVWEGDRIVGIRGMPDLPAERFAPVSDRELVRFSMEAAGAELRLRFEPALDGEALVLITAAGEARATKARD